MNGVLVKCLLYALFRTLNKMVSVLKCLEFCSCTIYLEDSLPDDDSYYRLPDCLTLFGELNKTIETFSSMRQVSSVISICLCFILMLTHGK